MKNLFYILLLMLALMLVSCNADFSGDGEITTAPATSAPTTTAPTTTVPTTTAPVTTGHTHAYGAWVITQNATCTVAGLEERACTCGERESRPIVAPGHTAVIDEAVAPTCMKEGKTEGRHCASCDTVFQAQSTLDKASHDFVNAICRWCRIEDTTPPLLTALTLSPQGGTLKAGDTLTIYLDIREESDISRCEIQFVNETTNVSKNIAAEFEHRADGKYEITYTIPEDMGAGKWVLNFTYVRDKWSLFTFGSGGTEDPSSVFFYVEGESSDTTPPILTALTLSAQGGTLKAFDTLTIYLDIREESDISRCEIHFVNETTNVDKNIVAAFEHRADGKYSITYTIPEDMGAGKWVLDFTFVRDEWSLFTFGSGGTEDPSSVFFYVEGESSDTTPPLLTALTISPQGGILKTGDTLTIYLDIREESDISKCEINFVNETTNVGKCIAAAFEHRADGKYKITYTIPQDMGAGKWVLDFTFVRDEWSLFTFGSGGIEDTSSVFFYVR